MEELLVLLPLFVFKPVDLALFVTELLQEKVSLRNNDGDNSFASGICGHEYLRNCLRVGIDVFQVLGCHIYSVLKFADAFDSVDNLERTSRQKGTDVPDAKPAIFVKELSVETGAPKVAGAYGSSLDAYFAARVRVIC